MSEATRATALAQAVECYSGDEISKVLEAAEAFHGFIIKDGSAHPVAPSKPAAPAGAPAAAAPAAAAPAKRGRPATEKPAAAAPAADLMAPTAPAAAPAAPAKVPEPTKPAPEKSGGGIDQVKIAMSLMLSKNLRPALVELLKKYGAESASSLKPEHYDGFIADADAAMLVA